MESQPVIRLPKKRFESTRKQNGEISAHRGTVFQNAFKQADKCLFANCLLRDPGHFFGFSISVNKRLLTNANEGNANSESLRGFSALFVAESRGFSER
jgi:hypothetical protein